jgi:hypothetical protein
VEWKVDETGSRSFSIPQGYPVLKILNIHTKYTNMVTARTFEIVVANETDTRLFSPDLLVPGIPGT